MTPQPQQPNSAVTTGYSKRANRGYNPKYEQGSFVSFAALGKRKAQKELQEEVQPKAAPSRRTAASSLHIDKENSQAVSNNAHIDCSNIESKALPPSLPKLAKDISIISVTQIPKPTGPSNSSDVPVMFGRLEMPKPPLSKEESSESSSSSDSADDDDDSDEEEEEEEVKEIHR